MHSQFTVRLPQDLNDGITNIAKRMRLKRSDIIRIAIENFIAGFEGKEKNHPYEKVKKLIGSIESGIPDLGEKHREYLIERIKKGA